MKSKVIRNACAASLGLLTLLIWASAASKPESRTPAPDETPERVIMRWPPHTRNAAGLLLEKYGRPDQFDRETLVWFNNGEWKRTIVHRKVSRRDPSGKTRDFLEQTLGYLVPADKIADIERFSPMIEVSRTAGEITCSSESESKNRLALNMADEIVTGKRGVADARAEYLKTSRLAASGKYSEYLEALQFDADNTRVMIPTGADR